jgi:hypothetical protein
MLRHTMSFPLCLHAAWCAVRVSEGDRLRGVGCCHWGGGSGEGHAGRRAAAGQGNHCRGRGREGKGGEEGTRRERVCVVSCVVCRVCGLASGVLRLRPPVAASQFKPKQAERGQRTRWQAPRTKSSAHAHAHKRHARTEGNRRRRQQTRHIRLDYGATTSGASKKSPQVWHITRALRSRHVEGLSWADPARCSRRRGLALRPMTAACQEPSARCHHYHRSGTLADE